MFPDDNTPRSTEALPPMVAVAIVAAIVISLFVLTMVDVWIPIVGLAVLIVFMYVAHRVLGANPK